MKVFVGSSMESQAVMHEIAAWLREGGWSVITWQDEEVFPPGKSLLLCLLDVLDKVDAAVLVFSPDDRTEVRRDVAFRPRDNVVLELGLFIGRLGPTRAIVCSESHETNGHARPPSDFQGVAFIDVTSRSPGRDRLMAWARGLERAAAPLGGVVGWSEPFPIDRFCESLESASIVRILQTFIPPMSHLGQLSPCLADVLRRGGRVEVLLCHHRSKACEIRQLALGSSHDVVGAIQQNVRTFARIHAAAREKHAPGQVELRAYASLPALTLYQADDAFLFGNYFHDRLAIHGPHLHARSNRGAWGRALTLEFSRLWDRAKTVDLDDPEGWLKGK